MTIFINNFVFFIPGKREKMRKMKEAGNIIAEVEGRNAFASASNIPTCIPLLGDWMYDYVTMIMIMMMMKLRNDDSIIYVPQQKNKQNYETKIQNESDKLK